MSLFSFWGGRRVLVTGHTGFKGAWLSLWLEHLGAHVVGLALPPEDKAGAFAAMSPWPRLDSELVDLRDGDAVAQVMQSANADVVFHLGAQALVRRGYADPWGTYAVNVGGTTNVLHALTGGSRVRAVVVITSDKVYADVGTADARPYAEDDVLGGDDPYSGSKALAEMLVRSYRATCLSEHPVAVATARAGNVIGGGDRGADRLLPDAWRALEAEVPLAVRHPEAVRPWQFVLESLYGYLLLAERLCVDPRNAPAAVNFGPDPASSATVRDIVEQVFALCGDGSWRHDPSPGPPETSTLRLDATLARTTLGWKPRLTLPEALAWTVGWWQSWSKGEDLRALALGQIVAYEELVRS